MLRNELKFIPEITAKAEPSDPEKHLLNSE